MVNAHFIVMDYLYMCVYKYTQFPTISNHMSTITIVN